jgi:hypothetical protein
MWPRKGFVNLTATRNKITDMVYEFSTRFTNRGLAMTFHYIWQWYIISKCACIVDIP